MHEVRNDNCELFTILSHYNGKVMKNSSQVWIPVYYHAYFFYIDITMQQVKGISFHENVAGSIASTLPTLSSWMR